MDTRGGGGPPTGGGDGGCGGISLGAGSIGSGGSGGGGAATPPSPSSSGGGGGGGRVIVRRASLGSQPAQERWVCPNDRHLALRAKLKMGWSTSQPAPLTRQDSMTEAETKMILEVIKRAEQLELTEQQRIG
nr:loricrin-like [Procambarus clarkii]